jgi:hypothetical protein
VQSVVKLGWFGLFVVLLGRFPTGSSFQLRYATALTDPSTSYHFVPHLSRKSFIVKQKLIGTIPTVGEFYKTTRPCG